jgi:hypothetical protein
MTTADPQRLPARPRLGGNQAFKKYGLRLYPGTSLICALNLGIPGGRETMSVIFLAPELVNVIEVSCLKAFGPHISTSK